MTTEWERANSKTTFGFDLLFADLPPGEFLKRYFPDRTFISHSDQALKTFEGMRIAAATPTTILQDFEGCPIRLWIDRNSYDVDCLNALTGFRNGGAIYIPNAERVYAELSQFRDQLCAELGVPSSAGSCSIFMSREGATVPMHFDHDFGFNMLVRGQKRWTLAKNDCVVWPTVGHDASREPLPLLKSYLDRNLPNTMPPSSVDVEVGPGAVCFIPRGYFHTTFARVDCIALDFAIDPPVWADYIGALVRNHLIAQPRGRESVLGAHNSSIFHADFQERLDAVIFSLPHFEKAVRLWSDKVN
jgi:hypothetical protein